MCQRDNREIPASGVRGRIASSGQPVMVYGPGKRPAAVNTAQGVNDGDVITDKFCHWRQKLADMDTADNDKTPRRRLHQIKQI